MHLSRHESQISQYKVPGQPYFWLFAAGDLIAGILVVVVALHIRKSHARSAATWWMVALIGVLMAVDSLAPVTCRMQGTVCTEYISPSFIIHAIESVALAVLVFVLSAVDAYRHNKTSSQLFVGFQVLYSLLFLVMIGRHDPAALLTQYLYQIFVALWLAVWIGSFLPDPLDTSSQTPKDFNIIRTTIAVWAYTNGVLAISFGLLHGKVNQFLGSLYIANDTAWLAQHTVITGLVMLYLSRHLMRGEYRARLIFMGLLFIEIIKYAVVTPRGIPLVLCLVSFVGLFCLGQYYKRGSKLLNWRARRQEVMTIVSGTIIAFIIPTIVYIADPHFAKIVNHTLQHFYGYTITYEHVPRFALKSSLLAHTLAALLGGLILLVAWALFRPARLSGRAGNDEDDREDARVTLEQYSLSSEDYFKLWPHDKQYFWNDSRNGFIAYKIVGPVCFALAGPIAPSQSARKKLLHTFVNHWHHAGYICCFMVIEEQDLSTYKTEGLNTLQIGSNAVIDIATFTEKTSHNKWWRWQRNRGNKQGYQYHTSTPPHTPQLLNGCEQISKAWLTRPGHTEQGFALGYHDTDYLQSCRIHYLTDESGTPIAFANELPTFAGSRQATVDLIRFDPNTQNAMPYLLLHTILDIHERGGYDHFDLGFVPLAQTDTTAARIMRFFGRKRFSAAGLEQFKNKFEPSWHANYLVYSGGLSDMAVIALNLEAALEPK
jgi:phosphatidylglycerol lysyltransferase